MVQGMSPCSLFFFFNDTATTEIYTLSLHDALPIWKSRARAALYHLVRTWTAAENYHRSDDRVFSDTGKYSAGSQGGRPRDHRADELDRSEQATNLLARPLAELAALYSALAQGCRAAERCRRDGRGIRRLRQGPRLSDDPRRRQSRYRSAVRRIGFGHAGWPCDLWRRRIGRAKGGPSIWYRRWPAYRCGLKVRG